MSEPDWLLWAREMQAIAQTGLEFTENPYDRERYEALRALAARAMAAHGGGDPARIEALFAGEVGYATPKIDVRGAAFRDGHILLVRERADEGRWTLPGGWADVNRSAAENAVKEALEESGYTVRLLKLAALWDRTRQRHPAGLFSCAKVFFVCEPTGGAAATSHETSAVGWFAEADLPQDLSLARVSPQQLKRMFAHRRDPTLPTDFD